jgi:nicotinamidase-related amidase
MTAYHPMRSVVGAVLKVGCGHKSGRSSARARQLSGRRRNGHRGTPTRHLGPTQTDIAPRPEDYVFLKRRPSAFYGTDVAEFLHMLRRDTIIIGGGATNRGVETSVREAFNLDLASVVVRDCCWSSDAAAHAYSLDKAMKMYARIRSLDQVTAMLKG